MGSRTVVLRSLGVGVLVLGLAGCGGTDTAAVDAASGEQSSVSAGESTGAAVGHGSVGVGETVSCADVIPRESELPSIAGNKVGFWAQAGFASARPMVNPADNDDIDPDVVSLVIDISGESAPTYRDGTAIQTGDVAIWQVSESPIPTSGDCTLLDDSPTVIFGSNQTDGRVTSDGAVWEVRTEALREVAGTDDARDLVLEIRSDEGEAHAEFETIFATPAAAHQCATADTKPMWC